MHLHNSSTDKLDWSGDTWPGHVIRYVLDCLTCHLTHNQSGRWVGQKKKILRGPRTASVTCCRVCGWCKLTSDLDPHTRLSNANWSSSMQISPNLHFQVILQADLRWPLTLVCDLLTAWTYEGSHIIPINQVWFKSDFQLFKWGHFHIFCLSYNLNSDDLWPWYVTFNSMNIWRFPYFINKPSLVPIRLQLFKWGHFHIFSLSYNLALGDFWPWYMTNLKKLWGAGG